jgi:hypothetical protein
VIGVKGLTYEMPYTAFGQGTNPKIGLPLVHIIKPRKLFLQLDSRKYTFFKFALVEDLRDYN